ncbi:DNA polymerase IV [Lapidilactobacillus mulanensis]|uniref:DNA polymerase IV n=1 Tax=Lapidilactobacillus mulanensis TaxID=2485999 RepID=A0ABW4DJF4_9LACO|nr:DNA polymerase IV [Lapidilactobacillus mulanensis]
MAEWLEIPLQYHTERKIIHVDMDAFYASVEIREHPELKTRAVVISADPRENHGHGVVTTANYVARQYGVHSAMPAAQALKLIPRDKVVFVPPHFELYRSVSAQIHQIFHQVTDIIEPISLDEAFLDVTENKWHETNTIKIAMRIQQQIIQTTHLTCSLGISYNKFLAKVASDHNKPVGRTIIRPEQAQAFLQDLPIDKFFGVGKKTQEVLHEMQVYTGGDLLKIPQMELIAKFNKMGFVMYKHARGVDDSPVQERRERRSIGKERTYNPPIEVNERVERELRTISEQVAAALAKQQMHGRVIVLKMRNSLFETTTKRQSFDQYVVSAEQIFQIAWQLWLTHGNLSNGIRLLGITVTELDPRSFENIDLPLFE